MKLCLSKRMNDSNVLVVTLSANAIEKLAKGLGNHFAQYRSMVNSITLIFRHMDLIKIMQVVSPLIERLKEKKSTVVEALSGALDAVFKSVRLDLKGL